MATRARTAKKLKGPSLASTWGTDRRTLRTRDFSRTLAAGCPNTPRYSYGKYPEEEEEGKDKVESFPSFNFLRGIG